MSENQGGEGSEEKFFSFSSEADGDAEAEGEASEAKDQSEESAEKSEGEIEEPALFTDESEDPDEEETDPELSLEEEPAEEEPKDEGEKVVTQKALRERLSKQKESLNRRHEAEMAKLTAELKERSVHSEVEGAIRAMYPEAENPFGAFVADKLVMDELLRMHGEGDPSAAKLVETAVTRARARSKGEKVTTTKTEAATKSEAPSDKRVEKLVERQVGSEIDSFLSAHHVKSEFKTALRKEMRSQLGKIEDVDDLTTDRLRTVVPKALRELGLKAEQVQERKSGAKAKSAPATGAVRGAAKSATGKANEGAKKEEPPKSIREWRESGDSLLESLRAG
jgi:hypothetical protein